MSGPPERRALGRTGLTVGAISLGTVELGLDYGIPVGDDHRRPAPREAERFVAAAVERGIDLVDTARAYGRSEAILGRALAGRPDVAIATKLDPSVTELHGSALRRAMDRSVEGSLRAFRRDQVDVLQLHSVSADDLARSDLLDELDRQRALGRTRTVGASVYGIDAAEAAVATGRLAVIQLALNPLDRAPAQGTTGRAATAGVGVVARSVLLRGALTPRFVHLGPELGHVAAAVRALLDATGVSAEDLPALAYRYVLAAPGVTTALVGTVRLDELEAALAAAAAGPLPPAVVAAIESVLADEAVVRPDRWPGAG